MTSGGGNAALQVLAWPVNGRPGKVDVLKMTLDTSPP